MGITTTLEQYLFDLSQKGLLRKRTVFSDKLLNFSSNDYLSLSCEPQIKHAFAEGFSKYAMGSQASMVVCGYHDSHQSLEKAFAEALDVDSCLLFSSGYAANLSIANLLGHHNTHVILDKQAHASIYDGLALAGCSYTRYLHNDLNHLSMKLQQNPECSKVIFTESIFSMSGQVASLEAMAGLAEAHHADMIVDEAHAFGVIGPEGLGAVKQAHLTQRQVPLRVIPLGKAFAASGAIVAGNGAWIEALLQTARAYIYSTGMSPAYAYGILKTLPIIRSADDRRLKLKNLINYFRHAIKSLPFKWRDSSSPIQQLQLGCPHLSLELAEKLKQKGILCLPMRQPTVNKQDTGLRVILNYQHEPEDIDQLLMAIQNYEHIR